MDMASHSFLFLEMMGEKVDMSVHGRGASLDTLFSGPALLHTKKQWGEGKPVNPPAHFSCSR